MGIDMDPNAYSLFTPPVPPAVHPFLCLLFLCVGTLLASIFVLYQVNAPAKKRALGKEVVLGLSSSVFLGLGALFLLLWTGLWV